jgi:hypothetical protein
MHDRVLYRLTLVAAALSLLTLADAVVDPATRAARRFRWYPAVPPENR